MNSNTFKLRLEMTCDLKKDSDNLNAAERDGYYWLVIGGVPIWYLSRRDREWEAMKWDDEWAPLRPVSALEFLLDVGCHPISCFKDPLSIRSIEHFKITK